MGVRGELFSTKVSLQNRTYFFNVKENRLGDLYLNIVESKNREEGGFERQSVILFAEDLQEFLKGFDDSLRVLEKAVREKRRGTGSQARDKAPRRASRPGEDRQEAPAGFRQGRAFPRRDDDNEEERDSRPYRAREKHNAPGGYGRAGEVGKPERAPRRSTGGGKFSRGGDERPGRDRQGNKEKDNAPSSKKRIVVKKR